MVSRLCSRFGDSDCKRCRPKNDNKLAVTPLAAWNLLRSQRQEFKNNHVARNPVTPNQQGTHEMKYGVLSSVGAQDMDTSGYQLSDL